MKKIVQTRFGNHGCAVMLLLLLVTQFLPFWNCTDCKDHEDVDKMVSIAEYVWFPDHHKPITKGMTDVYLDAYGEDYTDSDGKKFKFELNDIVLPLVVMFVGSIVGAVLCVMFSERMMPAFISVAVGGTGVFWYLTNPAMQIGQNWVLHLILAVLTLVAALMTIIIRIRAKVLDRKQS